MADENKERYKKVLGKREGLYKEGFYDLLQRSEYLQKEVKDLPVLPPQSRLQWLGLIFKSTHDTSMS